MLSWEAQDAVLRRKDPDTYFALLRDEYHQFAHPERDIRVQSLGRSQKFIGIAAYQNQPVLISALGGGVEAQNQANALYGLYVNKFMGSNNCHETNELNAETIGKEKKIFFGGSSTPSNKPEDYEWFDVLGVGNMKSFNFSQTWHYRVPPTEFMRLRTGGSEKNDWTVDAILHRGLDFYEYVSAKQR